MSRDVSDILDTSLAHVLRASRNAFTQLPRWYDGSLQNAPHSAAFPAFNHSCDLKSLEVMANPQAAMLDSLWGRHESQASTNNIDLKTVMLELPPESCTSVGF